MVQNIHPKTSFRANRYVFFFQAGLEIGAGHAMRCIALIEELVRLQRDVLIYCNISNLPWLEDKLRVLSNLTKIEIVMDSYISYSSDIAIIDSYDKKFIEEFIALNSKSFKIMLFDSDTPYFDVDLLIRCGPINEISSRKINSKLIYGLQYLPIRKSIREIPLLRKEDLLQPSNILILGGGADSGKFVHKLVYLLCEMKLDSKVHYVSMVPISGLSRLTNFIHVPIGNLLEHYLSETNLVFSLAGTTSWDVISRGIPLGVAFSNSNQYGNYSYQTAKNLALGVGEVNSIGEIKFNFGNINKLIANENLRLDLSINGKSTIDSLGCNRVVQELLKFET